MNQRFMSAPFADNAVLQHDNFASLPNRAQSMSDDQAGATAAPDVLQNLRFGQRVKHAGGFIEDEQRRAAD